MPGTSELFPQTLLYFISFFTLINPIGVMPVYMSMTSRLTQHQRRQTATRSVITAFIILVLFAVAGQFMFKFFGISVNGFRIAGGVIFFIMGYDMLNARLSPLKIDEKMANRYVEDISITPLGIPMLAGPGSITNALVLMEDAPNISYKVMLVVSIFITMLISLLVLLGAGTLSKIIGETGNKILSKLMGLIVMVIAVEFFFAGVTPIVRNILVTP